MQIVGMMVTFLPQLRGAYPKVLLPLGTLAYGGVRAVFDEHLSTNTSILASTDLEQSHQALRVC
jgi:hypothetical protein